MSSEPASGRFVTVGPGDSEGTPCATAALLASRPGGPSVVVVAPRPVGEMPPSVVDLLDDADLAIGVVVPAVVASPGRLVEAGAERSGGVLVARGAGRDPLLAPYRVRGDVDGTTQPWIAARRTLVAGADLDPTSDDPQGVVDALVARAIQVSLRVVYEPAWWVEADQAGGAGPSVTDEATPGTATTATPAVADILIVSAYVPGDPFRADDRSVQALVVGLASSVDGARITFVAADGFRADPAAQTLRDLGIEVVGGPMDWQEWFTANHARFSHVFLCWSGLHSDLESWLRRTQSQAVSVLYLPHLPFRDVTSLRPYTPADERDGLEWVRIEVEARFSGLGEWIDVAWCEQEADAAFVRGVCAFAGVSVIPPALLDRPPVTRGADLGERQGVVVVVPEGHDVVKANEEAALFVLHSVLPPLRRRHPELRCTVLSEAPTPRLQRACGDVGTTLVSLLQAPASIGRAALMIVGHQFGSGGPTAILAALESRTPFVATPVAAQGLELGELGPLALSATVPDLVVRADHLLGDEDARSRFVGAIDRLSAGPLSSGRRAQALRAALPFVGLPPLRHPVRSWPAREAARQPRPPLIFTRLRPAGTMSEEVGDSPELGGEDDRYRTWARRFGPNGSTLRRLREDLDTLEYRPRISVVMPVFNTDAGVLREAIESVRDQLYDNWQLCIADDHSQLPETRTVLEAEMGNPSIEVVRLAGQRGIAEATNAALALAEGEFVAFLDHDDLLKPHALAQVVRWLNADPSLDLLYSDEDKLDQDGKLTQPYLKPNWSPDLLRSYNYVTHLSVIRRSLVEALGGLRAGFEGSQDYDLILRATEVSDRIAHIPEPLYTWRIISGSAAELPDAKLYALDSAKRALAESLERRRVKGRIDDTAFASRYRTRYHLVGQPKVSIVIPTKDGFPLLRRCITSILERTTYRNYELVVIDNQSSDGETLGYLASLPARLIRYPHRFNYARMLNLAASTTACDALLFLNNDTEIISPDWIEALLEHAMRPEVGAVGGRLYFGDGRKQHEGILVGVGGWAGNIDHGGYWQLGDVVRNTSAVTGACTMMRPSVYWRVGGNDERLRVAYNDVDICLRIRQAGLQVVYTPYAELFHYESSTRSGYEHKEDGPLFGLRWEPRQQVDYYYSPVFHRNEFFQISDEEPDRALTEP